jgi:hypothetical protein
MGAATTVHTVRIGGRAITAHIARIGPATIPYIIRHIWGLPIAHTPTTLLTLHIQYTSHILLPAAADGPTNRLAFSRLNQD